MCLVARAGPCDAESASTQEDDYAALCWQALIQLMRERATSLDAILPVLREKRVERAIARGLVKALARRARRAASERRRASDRASASKSIGGCGRENQGAGKAPAPHGPTQPAQV